MNWSHQQEQALKKIAEWLKDKHSKQVFYLAGYAGTGKTTLAKHIGEQVKGSVCYAAFTGKAASVLQSKGCNEASTIHSLIYRVKDDKQEVPEWELNPASAVATAGLVIIDEVSMVDKELGVDLMSFGTRILVLGDPAQLPPVEGAGFFTSNRPDYMLTEIHRQARDNPIIELSMRVRNGEKLSIGNYGNSKIIQLSSLPSTKIMEADQLIVGRNKTRIRMNNNIRAKLNREGPFVRDEKVICLRNDSKVGVLNGTTWNVKNILTQTANWTKMSLEAQDSRDRVVVKAHHAFFRNEQDSIPYRERIKFHWFDFGYAITCHKSQGSQWDDVLIFDESWVFGEERNRWLYTAITRAAKNVTIVV